MRRFLPFARSLAMRYSGGVEPSDDLSRSPASASSSALERYDPDRGVPFAAFAGPTILGELRRHFRDRVWTLRVPRGLQESIRAVEGAITKLSHELERSPTVAEIADAARDRRGRRARGVRGQRRAADGLARPAAAAGAEPGDESPMAERIGGEDPGFELVEDRAAIDAGTEVLDETEREVLRLRFAEDLTQSKIAEQVGYSQMHVSRILRRALGKLRDAAAERRPRLGGLRASRALADPDREHLAVAVVLDPDLVGEPLERGVERGDPHSVEQPLPAAVPQRADPDLERAVVLGDRDPRGAVGEARGAPAEIASLSRTASESSSTERSARVANIEITRERIGAEQLAGRQVDPGPVVDLAASGGRLGARRWREIGTLIRTSVPWPGAPLISKLRVSAAISGRPRRRLRRSTSASGPDPRAVVAHARPRATSSSRQASTSSGPGLSLVVGVDDDVHARLGDHRLQVGDLGRLHLERLGEAGERVADQGYVRGLAQGATNSTLASARHRRALYPPASNG